MKLHTPADTSSRLLFQRCSSSDHLHRLVIIWLLRGCNRLLNNILFTSSRSIFSVTYDNVLSQTVDSTFTVIRIKLKWFYIKGSHPLSTVVSPLHHGTNRGVCGSTSWLHKTYLFILENELHTSKLFTHLPSPHEVFFPTWCLTSSTALSVS